jgi:hypothetical protein
VVKDASDPDDDLVHDLLRNDTVLRSLSRRIQRQQAELRDHVTPAAWRVYLGLEELVNERLVRLIERVVKRVRERPHAR